MPRFYVDGEKKNVCSTSWYFGNLPQHKKGKVELFWWPTLANDDKCDEEDQDSREPTLIEDAKKATWIEDATSIFFFIYVFRGSEIKDKKISG